MVRIGAKASLFVSISLSVALLTTPTHAQTCAPLRGVNLAGAEFGEALPGTFGTDYTYPSKETIKHFADLGAGIIRLPFAWPRLQRELYAPLDREELSRLKETVNAIHAEGMVLLLDPHDYARYKGQVVGSSAVPNAAFADFWRRLTEEFGGDDRTILSLTNEPYDMEARQWLRAANAAIAAIRQAGSRQLILVPGIHYTGAHSWQSDWPGGNNGRIMRGVVDPADNFAYDVHQYLDEDFSGRNLRCPRSKDALQALQRMTRWLDRYDKRAFLGEFGAAKTPKCLSGLVSMASYLNGQPERWIGWTAWAAGDWWPENDPLSLQPYSDGREQEQMLALKPYMRCEASAGSTTKPSSKATGLPMDLGFESLRR
ncbi:MAG: glycoside hydrolase family 5 protein [Pseudomonadota bacterium]